MAEQQTKVIVTGGAGFIGSHIVDTLVERGFDVHIVDTLLRGKPDYLNPKAHLHEVDIRDFEALAPLFKGVKYVFHAAALPRVQPSIDDPRTTNDVNATGTLNVLLAARDGGAKRVVYSASSSAYGNQETLPLREDMEARPLSPYGLQKYIGELQCSLFSRLFNLETVSLRYFNVYGPRAAGDGAYALVVARFIDQRKRGEALTVAGDGTNSRAYTHVSDVVRANLLASISSNVGKGEVINIGSENDYTVLNIADLIGGPKVFIEPRVEPKVTRADITKARELLEWEPKVVFEEGIQELKKANGLL